MTRPVQTGDMAIVVRSNAPENLGMVVEVGREMHPYNDPCLGPIIEYDGLFYLALGKMFLCTTTGRPFANQNMNGEKVERVHSRPLPAFALSPILPGEGEDQTLTWAPVPTTLVTA